MFAAGADALLTGDLTLCAGSCGPGGLHFINGVWESNRHRAPVVPIVSQVLRDEHGFDIAQEVDFRAVYAKGAVFCEEIRTPEIARRTTAMAAQAASSRQGVAVLIVPVDVSSANAPDEPAFTVHRTTPLTPRRRRHPVDIGVVGDVAATLAALLPMFRDRDDRASTMSPSSAFAADADTEMTSRLIRRTTGPRRRSPPSHASNLARSASRSPSSSTMT